MVKDMNKHFSKEDIQMPTDILKKNKQTAQHH